MSRYEIVYEPSARKDLRAILDWRVRNALEAAIAGLMDNPRPHGCIKLSGKTDEWRVRVGEWQVIYRIEEGRLVVVVVRVGPRGGVYG